MKWATDLPHKSLRCRKTQASHFHESKYSQGGGPDLAQNKKVHERVVNIGDNTAFLRLMNLRALNTNTSQSRIEGYSRRRGELKCRRESMILRSFSLN